MLSAHCYNAMQRGQFGEAFELTSNNRVDLNVIVDYAWPSFLSHADDFVREVQVGPPPPPHYSSEFLFAPYTRQRVLPKQTPCPPAAVCAFDWTEEALKRMHPSRCSCCKGPQRP